MDGGLVCNIQTIIESGVKMKVCDPCGKAQYDTLTSTRDGTQTDLCMVCKEKVMEYIEGPLRNPVQTEKRKPGRPAKETKGE